MNKKEIKIANIYLGESIESLNEKIEGYEKFELQINMGNEAMQTGLDVAEALRKLANRIESKKEYSGKIMDSNGNSVGTFKFK